MSEDEPTVEDAWTLALASILWQHRAKDAEAKLAAVRAVLDGTSTDIAAELEEAVRRALGDESLCFWLGYWQGGDR